MTFFRPLAILVALGLLAYAPLACASQIILDNSTFATLPQGGLPETNCGSDCAYGYGPIPGWTGAGTGQDNAGQFQPGEGNTAFFNSLPDGNTTAYSFGPSLSQVVDTAVQVGQAYTLTVEVGTRKDMTSAGSVDLLVNGVEYAGVGTLAAPGDWSAFTVTYVGLAVDMGDAMTIQLNDPVAGDVASFADVTLMEGGDPSSAVPEPAITGCAGMALFCLVAFYRRKFSPQRRIAY